MKKNCLWLAFSALLCIAVPGCHEDSSNNTQPPSPGDGTVVPEPTDTCDPPCSESQECIESSCQPKDNLCGGKVCAQDEQCVQDDCVPIIVDECTPECTEGTECINGKCEPIAQEDPCLNKQCADDEECVEGECQPVQPSTPDCGDEYCTSEQTCYQEHCVNNADFCGDVLCSDSQKCVDSQCVDKNDCDDKICEESTRCVLNSDQVGVCLEEACIVDDAPKQCGEGLKCKAGKCIDSNCDDGMIDEETGKCIIPVKEIQLDKTEFALLRYSSATIKAKVLPADATNAKLEWSIKNVSEGSYKDDDIKTLVEFTPKESSAAIKSKSIGSRMVEVTASSTDGSNIVAKATIELKPYMYYKFDTGKEDLKCDQYGTATTKVFNSDMYTEYVYPVMQKTDSGKYGTRASVVAAARFLTLQFPYFIPYYDNTHNVSECPTESHYVWASGTLAEEAQKVRIFGLNLTKNAYNSYETDEKAIVKTDVVPWACDFPNKKSQCNGSTTTDSGKTVSKPNGLACSGFVAWAFRNGRFYVGDWWTHVFGPDFASSVDQEKDKLCKNSSGKIIRNFYCENVIHGVSPARAIAFANPNNKHDSAYAKFKQINDEKDYIRFSDLTDAQFNDIKAGDLLWHVGHIAMIIGIDHKGKNIYIGQASGKGNEVKKLSLTYLKTTDYYVIKLDNLYNYYSKTYNLPEDGNTYKYTDMWPQ